MPGFGAERLSRGDEVRLSHPLRCPKSESSLGEPTHIVSHASAGSGGKNLPPGGGGRSRAARPAKIAALWPPPAISISCVK